MPAVPSSRHYFEYQYLKQEFNASTVYSTVMHHPCTLRCSPPIDNTPSLRRLHVVVIIRMASVAPALIHG